MMRLEELAVGLDGHNRTMVSMFDRLPDGINYRRISSFLDPLHE